MDADAVCRRRAGAPPIVPSTVSESASTEKEGAANPSRWAACEGSAEQPGPYPLSMVEVLCAFSAVATVSVVAWALEVDLSEEVLVASLRSFVQLTCLGAVLAPLFATPRCHLVLAYILMFMVPLASYEATARSKLTYPNMFSNTLASITAGVVTTSTMALLIVRPKPWYCAKYLVPLAGMLINNSLSSTALALDQMLDNLVTKKDRVEIMLSFGATPWEAVWPEFADTFRKALMPTLSSMNVIGLISIPGMMTGQVLAGASPAKAARYQIVIMYLITSCNALSTSMICGLTVRDMFDHRGRLLSSTVAPQSLMKVSQLLSPKGWISKERLVSAAGDLFESLPPLELKLERRSAVGNNTVLEFDLRGSIAGKRSFHAAFALSVGEVASLMGPSGVGKSTLFRMMTGLLPVDNVSLLTLNGKNHSEFPAQVWRRQVLYVHQGRIALPSTPWTLIRDVAKLKVNQGQVPPRPERCLQEFGLSVSTLHQPWSELSGGEAQRVMLCIAFSMRPRVLLLDEPTSALDESARDLVEQKISVPEPGTAVLLITHDSHQAERVASSVWHLLPKESDSV